mmetsp:Transcript_6221/g.13492  ORF Transcript_6221/g.13492 Transcript_6221/m.13492 type:complete len:315 (-) Transcript_6221:241-1185(-)
MLADLFNSSICAIFSLITLSELALIVWISCVSWSTFFCNTASCSDPAFPASSLNFTSFSISAFNAITIFCIFLTSALLASTSFCALLFTSEISFSSFSIWDFNSASKTPDSSFFPASASLLTSPAVSFAIDVFSAETLSALLLIGSTFEALDSAFLPSPLSATFLLLSTVSSVVDNILEATPSVVFVINSSFEITEFCFISPSLFATFLTASAISPAFDDIAGENVSASSVALSNEESIVVDTVEEYSDGVTIAPALSPAKKSVPARLIAPAVTAPHLPLFLLIAVLTSSFSFNHSRCCFSNCLSLAASNKVAK